MRAPGTSLCGVMGSFDKIQGSVVLHRLTLKALITTTADDSLKCLCFGEKVVWLADANYSQEISGLIFSENSKTNLRISSYTIC